MANRLRKDNRMKQAIMFSSSARPTQPEPEPRADMAQIAQFVQTARKRMMHNKNEVVGRLESGTTLEFSVSILERMNQKKLEQMCRKYKLKTGKTEEMRGRLADLLLSEKKRTNDYLGKKAHRIVGEILHKVEEDTEDLHAHLMRAVGDGVVDIFDLNQKTETLTAGNKERLEVLQDLDYWHAHFQAIMASDFDEDEDDCLKDGEWDEMLDTKHSARIKIRAMFDKMMKELTDKRLNLLDISNAVKRAEATQLELEGKFTAAKRKTDDYSDTYNGLHEGLNKAEREAKAAAQHAKAARTDNDSALKHLRENIVEWERLEAELRARLEIEKKQFQREIDELNRKLEEEKRNFQLRHDRETQTLRDHIEAEKARMQSAYEEKLAELVADLKRKGMAEASSLAKEIADVEARIAELERQLAAARGEIDALEARLAEVEAAADAAEAERNAANDAFVDPDIALLREHYDKYQHWLKHIRDRVFEEVEVQAVKSNVHTIPHTESSFKPAAGLSAAEALGGAKVVMFDPGPMPPPPEIPARYRDQLEPINPPIPLRPNTAPVAYKPKPKAAPAPAPAPAPEPRSAPKQKRQQPPKPAKAVKPARPKTPPKKAKTPPPPPTPPTKLPPVRVPVPEPERQVREPLNPRFESPAPAPAPAPAPRARPLPPAPAPAPAPKPRPQPPPRKMASPDQFDDPRVSIPVVRPAATPSPPPKKRTPSPPLEVPVPPPRPPMEISGHKPQTKKGRVIVHKEPVKRISQAISNRKQVQEQKRAYEGKAGSKREQAEKQQAARVQTYVTVDKNIEKNLVAALPPHLAKLVAKQADQLPSGVGYVEAKREERIKGSAAASTDSSKSPAKDKARQRYKRALTMIKAANKANAVLTEARENLQTGVVAATPPGHEAPDEVMWS